jgi:hypothetical protein
MNDVDVDEKAPPPGDNESDNEDDEMAREYEGREE